MMTSTTTVDPHEAEFGRLMTDVLVTAQPLLLELVLRPVDRPDEHPMANIAQLAKRNNEAPAVRERLLRVFEEDTKHLPDRKTTESRIAQALAIYDAAIKGDPIELREAVRLAGKAGTRSEWSEAV